MKTDPPVRRDGLCVQCHGPRKVPKRHHKGIDPAVYALDPFCSSPCARFWHGNPLPIMAGGNPKETRGRHERVAA